MNPIIEQLKRARQAQGLKQSELGRKLGLPQSHISKIECEKTDPCLSTIADLARTLDQELMLIPRQQAPHILAIIKGEDLTQPLWQPDENEDIPDDT